MSFICKNLNHKQENINNVAKYSISLTYENFNLNRGSDKIIFLKLLLHLLARNTCLIIKPDAKIHYTCSQTNKDISCVNGDTIEETYN